LTWRWPSSEFGSVESTFAIFSNSLSEFSDGEVVAFRLKMRASASAETMISLSVA